MVDLDNLPGSILDATAAAIGESYDCTRVWSAWGYGTMSQDDFVRIDHDNDRVAEIAKSAVEAFINETGFYSIVAERDALKAELKATESRLHEVAVGCANAEAELEAAKENHRLHAAKLISEKILVSEQLEAARQGNSEREEFNAWNNEYSCPLAGRDPKSAAWMAWQARAQLAQVPAQKAESPWQVITNENWNIPKLGQRVILFSNGAIQNDSYTLDRGDDGYFWSRDDVDECPEVRAGDAWMPWPSEIKGGENER